MTGGAPRWSVVVPTHGRPAYLAEALASIRAQDEHDLEVVVVDDASPEPVALAEDVVGGLTVKLVRRDVNGGPAAARNTGVAESCGQWMAFLDDDDWWEPGWLAAAGRELVRSPVVVGWSRYHDEPGRPGRVLVGHVGDVVLDAITPHLGATALRREAWSPFDERYLGSEDVAWWLDTARRWPLATVGRHVNVIRRHTGQRTTHGAEARAAGARRLLDEHADYFADHPSAAAFRLRRLGHQELAAGNTAAARRAFLASMRRRPTTGAASGLARSVTWSVTRPLARAVKRSVTRPGPSRPDAGQR